MDNFFNLIIEKDKRLYISAYRYNNNFFDSFDIDMDDLNCNIQELKNNTNIDCLCDNVNTIIWSYMDPKEEYLCAIF